jgi:hypothetical protein
MRLIMKESVSEIEAIEIRAFKYNWNFYINFQRGYGFLLKIRE